MWTERKRVAATWRKRQIGTVCSLFLCQNRLIFYTYFWVLSFLARRWSVPEGLLVTTCGYLISFKLRASGHFRGSQRRVTKCQRRSSSLFNSRVFCLKNDSGYPIFRNNSCKLENQRLSGSSPYYHAFIPVAYNHYSWIFFLLEIRSFSHPLHHSTVLFCNPGELLRVDRV